MKNNFKKFNTGYTIIETMIAVSLFLVVVTISINSLLNSNVLLNKSKDMRAVIDNLSFIMEDMSRNIRTGSVYRCTDTFDKEPVPQSCVSGGTLAFTEVITQERWVYKIESQDGGETFHIYKSINNGTTFVKLTDDLIILSPQSGFSVLGAESLTNGDNQQPFVTIRLVGEIIYRGVSTPFSLQNSVSQTEIDIL